MPETMEGSGADAQSPDDGDAVLSNDEHISQLQLTPKEERFVGEYLIDMNATAAYKRSFPGVTDGTARTNSAKLMAKANIAAAIAIAQAERARRTEISADHALLDVWYIARADARELSQVKVDACRNCYGEGFQRQRTVGEMNRDREKHAAKGSADDFDEEGGIGFDPLRPPHKDCPGCGGDGHALDAELEAALGG